MIRKIVWLMALALPQQVFADEPTPKEFADYILSGSSYLQQCISRELIPQVDLPDSVFTMAETLGFLEQTDWFLAMQRGVKGEIYDMFQEQWVPVSYSEKNCVFIRGEQQKVKNTLSRYF